MAFNLGQFRRDQKDTSFYTTDLSYTLEDLVTSTDSKLINYLDKQLRIDGGIKHGENYYLRLRIYKIADYNTENVAQQIEVTLENSSEADNETQYIDTFRIPKGSQKTYSVFEMILSPNGTYNQVKFALQRNEKDYQTPHKDDKYYGRTMKIEIEACAKINNLCGNSYVNNGIKINVPETLTKIGIQGPPGLLMCINGEAIRIGPSGIYEINNGYKVTFLGFIVRESRQRKDRDGVPDYDYFIMDYQY